MSGDVHVRFRERPGGRFPGATRLVLLAPDRAQLLVWQARIEGFLAGRLGLPLHPRRVLKPVGDGADFLGYSVRPRYRLVRRRVVGHFKERLAAFQRRLIRGRVASGQRLNLDPALCARLRPSHPGPVRPLPLARAPLSPAPAHRLGNRSDPPPRLPHQGGGRCGNRAAEPLSPPLVGGG
jgi:hypothetical protein